MGTSMITCDKHWPSCLSKEFGHAPIVRDFLAQEHTNSPAGRFGDPSSQWMHVQYLQYLLLSYLCSFHIPNMFVLPLPDSVYEVQPQDCLCST